MGVKINKNSKITMHFRDEIKADLAAKKKQRPKSQDLSSEQSSTTGVTGKKERRKSLPARLIEESKAKKAEEEKRKAGRAKVLGELIKLQDAVKKIENQVKNCYSAALNLKPSIEIQKKSIPPQDMTREIDFIFTEFDSALSEISNFHGMVFGNLLSRPSDIKGMSIIEAIVYLLKSKEAHFDNPDAVLKMIYESMDKISNGLTGMEENYKKMKQLEQKLKQKLENLQIPVKIGMQDTAKRIDRYSSQFVDIFKQKGQEWKKFSKLLESYASTKPEDIKYDLGIKRLAGKAASVVKKTVTGAAKKVDPSLKLLQVAAKKIFIPIEKQAEVYAGAMKYVGPAQVIKMSGYFEKKSKREFDSFFNTWANVNNTFAGVDLLEMSSLEKFMNRLRGIKGKKFKNSTEAEKELKSTLKSIEDAIEKLKKDVSVVVPILKM